MGCCYYCKLSAKIYMNSAMDDDDTHLCLRCSTTIIGLDSYVLHRKQHCPGSRSLIPDGVVEDIPPVSSETIVDTTGHSSEADQTTVSYESDLTANDFFTSLELQSTTSLPRSIPTGASPSLPMPTRDVFSWPKEPTLPNGDSLPASRERTNSPTEHSDADEESPVESEDGSDDLYPPRSHTGGKWKPGCRPSSSVVQHWESAVSPNSPQNSCKYAETFTDEQQTSTPSLTNVMALNSFNSGSETIPPVDEHKFCCCLCSRNFCDIYSYRRHLTSTIHQKRSVLHQGKGNTAAPTPGAIQPRTKADTKSTTISSESVKLTPHKTNPSVTPDTTDLITSKVIVGRHHLCNLCGRNFDNLIEFAMHLLHDKVCCNEKRDKQWQSQIFQHENTLIKMLPFQCLICSFYCNTEADLSTHIKSRNHRHKAAQMSRPTVCIVCEFECRSSDDMIEHLTSRDHQQCVMKNVMHHPIVIAAKKKSKMCTFCPGKCAYLSQNYSSLNSGATKGKQYTCKHCAFLTTSKTSLNDHYHENHHHAATHHNSDNPLIQNGVTPGGEKCFKKKHDVLAMKCLYCFDILTCVQDWKAHIRDQHPQECPECTVCKKTFISTGEIDRHYVSKSHLLKEATIKRRGIRIERGKLSCSKCSFSCKEEKDLLIHSIHHQTPIKVIRHKSPVPKTQSKQKVTAPTTVCRKKFRCPYCQKLLAMSNLRWHINCHTGDRPYTCHICKKGFPRRSSMQTHVKRHLGLAALKCSQCNFKTFQHSNLKKHEATHIKDRPRPYLCDICGAAQLDSWSLKKHIQSHGQFTHRCPHDGCRLTFRSPSHLKQHAVVHNTELPYLCDTCGYKARTIYQLRKHQRTHTGEKPYQCKYCSYSAAYSSHMKRHVRLHSGSKPYRCPYCDYSCNTQENIRKHILKTKKHVGKKMYPCKFCTFGCNEFMSYRDHLLGSHGEHFPRGERDIESSTVAGLYVKETSEVLEKPIPYAPKRARLKSASDGQTATSRAKTCKTGKKEGMTPVIPSGTHDKSMLCIKIPCAASLDSVEALGSKDTIEASNAPATRACLSMVSSESETSNLPETVVGSEQVALSNSAEILPVDSMHLLISGELANDVEERYPHCVLTEPGGVAASFTHTATVDGGSGNTIYIYMPIG